MIKARGKRTVHFHRLPRDFFFQHLRTFPVRCMVARSQGGGRGGAGREDEQDDGRPSNEDIASRCCLVCARCLRGQVRKRGHSRISRRDPPIPLLYILIGTIERLSRDNGQDYAQESVSSVHVGVTRAIRHLSRCVHHARSQHRLDSRWDTESQLTAEKAYPLHLVLTVAARATRPSRRGTPTNRVRRFLFSHGLPSFVKLDRVTTGSRETFDRERMSVFLFLIVVARFRD